MAGWTPQELTLTSLLAALLNASFTRQVIVRPWKSSLLGSILVTQRLRLGQRQQFTRVRGSLKRMHLFIQTRRQDQERLRERVKEGHEDEDEQQRVEANKVAYTSAYLHT